MRINLGLKAVLAAQLMMPLISDAALVEGDQAGAKSVNGKSILSLSQRRQDDGYVLMQDMEVKQFDLEGDEVADNGSEDDGSQAELNILENFDNAELGKQGEESNSAVVMPKGTRFFVADGVIDPEDGQKYIQVELESGFKFWTSLNSFEQALYVAEGQVAGRAAGTITSRPGWRVHPITRRMKCHEGTDIAYPTGTSIGARNGSGKVVQAGWLGGYGYCVTIHHPNGMMSRYGHLSRIGVRVGQTVNGGESIGRSGSTGHSTGPHLHYEYKKIGSRICGGRGGGGTVRASRKGRSSIKRAARSTRRARATAPRSSRRASRTQVQTNSFFGQGG